jgi:hypothetical protein
VTQLIDVSGGLSGGLINAGVVGYELSGFFSSYLDDDDYGAVNVEFLNSANVRIGENEINAQGDTATWVQKMTTGGVPAGTTTVRISIFGVRITGGGPDGYIDNVDFQLSATPPELVAIVNRDTGNITIHNLTGSAENISGYSITSEFEGLKPLSWTSIADNYDSGNPGPNQVDPAHAWTKLTDLNTHGDLSEADLVAGTGANLANNRTVNLGNTWIQTPTEDLIFRYVSNGQVVTGGVSFIGNDNESFAVADLNTNGVVNSADWAIFRANQHGDLSGLSLAEAYRAGDMNGDKLNNFDDFVAFKAAYEWANGGGSFAIMLSSIPEPSSIFLAITSGLLAMPLLRRRQ